MSEDPVILTVKIPRSEYVKFADYQFLFADVPGETKERIRNVVELDASDIVKTKHRSSYHSVLKELIQNQISN